MVKVVDFSHSGHFGESAIQNVAKRVSETATRPEMSNATAETIVKESIKSIAEKIPEVVSPLPIIQSISNSQTKSTTSQNGSSLPSYLDTDTNPKDEAIKNIVSALVESVFIKGLDHAIGIAKKQPPFVEDAFHDALVEKMVPELRRRGILK